MMTMFGVIQQIKGIVNESEVNRAGISKLYVSELSF